MLPTLRRVFRTTMGWINTHKFPWERRILNTVDTFHKSLILHDQGKASLFCRSIVLTRPVVTVASASARSACTPPGWRCRWSPSWLTGFSHCSPAPGSVAGCNRTGWSGRPWGGPGKTVRHSFQPEGHRQEKIRHGWGYASLPHQLNAKLPLANNTILWLNHLLCPCRGTEKYQEQSLLYPARWLAGVFSKAQQQVENGPAMLQNTLSNT